MARAYMDQYITKVDEFIKRLKTIQKTVEPKLERVLEKWVVDTEKDAIRILNRPNWILPKSISSKVKDYTQNHKLFAMVGFRFRERNNKRDPGYYGQFHEAGWAPIGHKVTAPDHFLRKAKKKNRAPLDEEVRKVFCSYTDTLK